MATCQAGVERAYAPSAVDKPILHISEAGADATAAILHFAAAKGVHVGDRLRVISMGRGQGHHADEAIQKASVSGDWVCISPRRLRRPPQSAPAR